MQTLQANGMNPIAKPCRMGPRMRSPTPKLASSLFSPPQPADVKQLPLDAQLPHGSGQLPQQGRVWRRNHVDNQKLYDVSRPLPCPGLLLPWLADVQKPCSGHLQAVTGNEGLVCHERICHVACLLCDTG